MVSRVAAFLVLVAVSSAALAQRPPLRGVSAIRIANYGAPSVLLEKRDEVAAILEELNQLRRKTWRREDTALHCYSTVMVMQGKKRIAEFRVRPEQIVERPVDKGQSAYTLVIEPADMPRLSQMLSGIAPAVCR